MSVLARVFKGLGRSLQKGGAFLGLLVLIAAAALVVAIPLWYFSSNFASGYTIFVIVLVAAAVLSALIGRLIRLSRETGALRMYLNRTMLPILKTAAVVVLSIAVIYGIAFLISRGLTVVAILCAVVWVLLLGFLKYARQGKS